MKLAEKILRLCEVNELEKLLKKHKGAKNPIIMFKSKFKSPQNKESLLKALPKDFVILNSKAGEEFKEFYVDYQAGRSGEAAIHLGVEGETDAFVHLESDLMPMDKQYLSEYGKGLDILKKL